MKKIKVAIVGVGNCAKSLVEGIQYYIENPDDQVGLMYSDIGGYSAKDINFVCGFDVDIRKAGKSLKQALRAKPNCAMDHVDEINRMCIELDAPVYSGPVLDGVPDYMLEYPEDISFRLGAEPAISVERYIELLKYHNVDIVINYLPVGSREASKFYLENALKAGCHVINCMPSYISTKDAMYLEQLAIDNKLTIIGSDMRSGFGASRLSEILQGSMLDAGLLITYHVQENKIGGCSQGKSDIRSGVSSNTDFLVMSKQDRLIDKHISKENVLKGQNLVRGIGIDGMTLYAGPSLTIHQKPGGKYIGSDNKIANIDMIAYGFAGARYEMTARLSVQDSPNSGSVTISAIRFCKVASEMGIVGNLRGASAWTQKTPNWQMTTSDAKFECDALARRELTKLTIPQLIENNPIAKNLPYTFQKDENDYG